MQGDRRSLAGVSMSASDEPPVFYSVPKAARQLGMSPATLYRAIAANQFPAIRIRGRLLVLREVIDQILAAARAGQTVDVAKWAAPHHAAQGRGGGGEDAA
jgi:excisionase family DNA binding protein